MRSILTKNNRGNIRTYNKYILSDFVRSSFVGRVGQGLCILLAYSHGKKFVGHLSNDANVQNYINNKTGKNKKVADFIFTDSSKKTYIYESKSTFSLDENDSVKIKSILKNALEKQVEPWIKIISPNASNGCSSYSCIRDLNAKENSIIAYVDPESSDNGEVEYSYKNVIGDNYNAVFDCIGLNNDPYILDKINKMGII